MTDTHRTSWIATGLAAAAAALGLTFPEVYPSEAGTDAMLRGYDLVTLVVVAPALALALLAGRRPGPAVPARLLEVGLLSYLVYTYVYYVLGTGFADLLLLHVVVLASALVALVVAVSALDVTAVKASFSWHTRVRPAAVVLALLALALGVMWTYWSLDAAATGEVPPGSALVESDTVVHLGVVLDLTLLVPLYSAAAVLLWRKAAWGYVLGLVALVAGLLHQVSYVVALAAQALAGVPGAVAFDPFEPVIVLLYAVALAMLLLGLRRTAPAPGAPPPSLLTPRYAVPRPRTDPRRHHVDAR